MIGFAELLRHTQCCFAVLAKEIQKVQPGDEIRLSRLDYICRELVRLPGNGGGPAQDLSEILRMRAFASADEVDNLTLPLHKMKTPRGNCPSTKRVAPFG